VRIGLTVAAGSAGAPGGVGRLLAQPPTTRATASALTRTETRLITMAKAMGVPGERTTDSRKFVVSLAESSGQAEVVEDNNESAELIRMHSARAAFIICPT
jgi:hypothetical protein